MPPKGRRGSDLTTPLTKTAPASTSAARRSARAGAEAERGVVGEPDRVPLVLGADHRGRRAEGLLVEGGHAAVHHREQGGRIEGPAAGRHLSAEQGAGPALHRLL